MKSLTNYFQYKKRDDGKHSDIIIKIKYLIKKLKNADDESIFAQKYQNLFGDDYKDVIKHPININQIIKKNFDIIPSDLSSESENDNNNNSNNNNNNNNNNILKKNL
ncbi:hypothetical protein M9Y10_013805 [Tritrichomonas musculus]|uniref:Bromo domain-containing protein n=1 Tax=Tritrichomonas musculus TaxID=1915356 RepID=A0ABR2GMD0_9EUKA